MITKCSNCLYAQMCGGTSPCEDYAAIDLTDEEVDELIELDREEFRSAWNQYISDFN